MWRGTYPHRGKLFDESHRRHLLQLLHTCSNISMPQPFGLLSRSDISTLEWSLQEAQSKHTAF